MSKNTWNQVPFGTSGKQSGSTPVKQTAFRQQTRKIILKQQACCQYVDPVTGRACKSQWFLQTDHRHSLWAGGDSEIENAQVLCAAHNRYKYRKEAGIHRV